MQLVSPILSTQCLKKLGFSDCVLHYSLNLKRLRGWCAARKRRDKLSRSEAEGSGPPHVRTSTGARMC